MQQALSETGIIAPARPDPKQNFISHNHWYLFPKELSGKVFSSLDELIHALKEKEIDNNERFIGGFIAGNMQNLGVGVVGYKPHLATLQVRGEHLWEFKVGYQCGSCHKIITGVPEIKVSQRNTSLTLICGNEVCKARLYEKPLNYLYYNRTLEE